jgi:hypothetical protein
MKRYHFIIPKGFSLYKNSSIIYQTHVIISADRYLINQIEKLVEEIIAAKTANPDADIISLPLGNGIDRVVYSLYRLTAKGIVIVEENV